jgi:hypothetical protein
MVVRVRLVLRTRGRNTPRSGTLSLLTEKDRALRGSNRCRFYPGREHDRRGGSRQRRGSAIRSTNERSNLALRVGQLPAHEAQKQYCGEEGPYPGCPVDGHSLLFTYKSRDRFPEGLERCLAHQTKQEYLVFAFLYCKSCLQNLLLKLHASVTIRIILERVYKQCLKLPL